MSLHSEFTEKRDEIRAKRVALKSLFDEREKAGEDTRGDKDEAIKQASLELNDLVDAFDPVQDRYAAWKQNDDALKAMGDQRQIIDDEHRRPRQLQRVAGRGDPVHRRQVGGRAHRPAVARGPRPQVVEGLPRRHGRPRPQDAAADLGPAAP